MDTKSFFAGPNLPYASVLPPGQESGVESIVQLLDNCDARPVGNEV